MDFNSVEAQAHLVELFRKAAGDPVAVGLAQAAANEFLGVESGAARFAASEGIAAHYLGISQNGAILPEGIVGEGVQSR